MLQRLENVIFRPSQESATSEVKLIQTTKDSHFKWKTAILGTKEKKKKSTALQYLQIIGFILLGFFFSIL